MASFSIESFLSFLFNFAKANMPLFSSWLITGAIGIGIIVFFALNAKTRKVVCLGIILLLGYVTFRYFTQPQVTAPVQAMPEKQPFKMAEEFQSIHEQLIPYFDQIGNALPDDKPAVAMYPFTMTGGGEPPILKYLTESMAVTLSTNSRMQLGIGLPKAAMGIPADEIRVLDGLPTFEVEPELVRRQVEITDSEDGPKAVVAGGGKKAQFILFGKVTPLGRRIRFNVQIVNTDTAEVLEALNKDMNKDDIVEFL